MGSIIFDETDFREHGTELGILHIECDNRLPRVGNVIAKLLPGILRLVPGEEHNIRANPQNASIVHHAHPAMGICGRGEQTHGKQPCGYSSNDHDD
jgi:hypothetical protein